MRMPWIHLGVLLLASAGSARADERAWETVSEGPIQIKTRALGDTGIKEIWAEGELAASVQDVQTALMTPDRFPKFMPFVKEARTLGPPAADGTWLVYTRLDLPMVNGRDYFSRVTLEQGVAPDGSGEFRNHWVAVKDRPPRQNIVRLTHNEGSWKVTAKGPGRSYAVYRFSVDPGGWIPTFAAEMGNKSGVADTFKAVEKEAQRLGKERKSHAGSP